MTYEDTLITLIDADGYLEAIEELKIVYSFCNTEPQMQAAINTVIKHSIKYAWHDLRKDPNDLPPHGRNVVVLTEGFGIGASIYTHTIGHWNKDKGKWRFDSVAYPIPIAWKEI